MSFRVTSEEGAPSADIADLSPDIYALGGEFGMGRVYIVNQDRDIHGAWASLSVIQGRRVRAERESCAARREEYEIRAGKLRRDGQAQLLGVERASALQVMEVEGD